MHSQHVIVDFGGDQQFDFKLDPADPAVPDRGDARDWFDREFVALECDVPSPMGKVLTADRVLGVARYSGAQRFRDHPDWAREFARHAGALLGRDLVRVDVPGYTIGF